MNDIDIIKKAVSKKHRCDPVHEAIERVEAENSAIKEAFAIMAVEIRGIESTLRAGNGENHAIQLAEYARVKMLKLVKELP